MTKHVDGDLATQFHENGVLKCKCPKCGYVQEMDPEFKEIIAYVCAGCDGGFEVKPIIH